MNKSQDSLKKIRSLNKLLVLTIPTYIVYVFIGFFVISLLNSHTSSLDLRSYYFVTSLIASLLFSFYLGIQMGDSNGYKFVYGAEIFSLFFYITAIATIFSLLNGNIQIQSIGYLIFLMSMTNSLVYRFRFGGFPLFSFVFNYILMYIASKSLYLEWIPVIFVLIQTTEKVFEVKYKFALVILETKYLYLVVQFSLYAFYAAWMLSK